MPSSKAPYKTKRLAVPGSRVTQHVIEIFATSLKGF